MDNNGMNGFDNMEDEVLENVSDIAEEIAPDVNTYSQNSASDNVTADAAESFTDVENDNYYDTQNAGNSVDSYYGGYTPMSIAAMVCGILSMLCCCNKWVGAVFAVAGVALGIVSMKNDDSGRGMAIAGISTGVIGVILCLLISIFAGIASGIGSFIGSLLNIL